MVEGVPDYTPEAMAATLKGFLDDLNAAGVIPVSLTRWELTGQADAILHQEPSR